MFRGYVSFGEGTCFCIYVLPSTIPKTSQFTPKNSHGPQEEKIVS